MGEKFLSQNTKKARQTNSKPFYDKKEGLFYNIFSG